MAFSFGVSSFMDLLVQSTQFLWSYFSFFQWRAERGADGATAPGIQNVKLQKLKCCIQMIFPVVRLLTHAAWIWFFQTWFFINTSFYVFQMPVILIFLNTRDLCSRCAAHTQPPTKLMVTWLIPDRAIKRKSQKRIERQGRRTIVRAVGYKKSWGQFKRIKNRYQLCLFLFQKRC